MSSGWQVDNNVSQRLAANDPSLLAVHNWVSTVKGCGTNQDLFRITKIHTKRSSTKTDIVRCMTY